MEINKKIVWCAIIIVALHLFRLLQVIVNDEDLVMAGNLALIVVVSGIPMSICAPEVSNNFRLSLLSAHLAIILNAFCKGCGVYPQDSSETLILYVGAIVILGILLVEEMMRSIDLSQIWLKPPGNSVP